MHASWLSEVDRARFDEYLKVLWPHVVSCESDELPPLPEGIGEVSERSILADYAVDRRTKFAAFRWDERKPESGELTGIRFETFFLCPASSSPRIGLRIRALAEGLQCRAPDWWASKLGLSSQPHAGRPLPSFLELTALLASNGEVSTTSAEMHMALQEATRELSYYRQLSDEQAEELRQARSKMRENWFQPRATEDQVDELQPAPAQIIDLSGLPDWATANESRITILPRALYGAKKSHYEAPASVYAGLEILAGPYRDNRLGLLDKAGFDSALAKAGLRMEGSAAPSTAGEQGDAYFVTFNGRRRFLSDHLLKGGGRDERYCLRIYFFWDEDIQQAVVGWLPSHLNNSLS